MATVFGANYWLDEQAKRPVTLHLDDREPHSEDIPVTDVLSGKHYKCHYLLLREITDLEVIAWSAI